MYKTLIFKSFRDSLGKILVDLGLKNKDIVLVDPDVSKSARSDLFKAMFPDRFISVGISEQDLIGVSAGLAVAGKIPIVCSYCMFLTRAWEQIRNTICKDNLNVKIVVTHAGLSDHLDGYSHQCFEDIALYRVIPNMKVIVPADSYSLKELLNQAIEGKGPYYIRIGRDNEIPVYDSNANLEIGKANIIFEGKDAYIISCGTMVGISIEICKILKEKGLNVGVIDSHTIKPLDGETIINAAKETSIIFTLEEHNVLGGLGSVIAEVLSEYRPTYIKRIGIYDQFGTCARSYHELLEYFNLLPEQIAHKIERILNSN